MARHRIQIRSQRMIDGMVVSHELFLKLPGQISDVEQRAEGEFIAIYFTADENVNLDFLRPHVLPPKNFDLEPVRIMGYESSS
jgi:hypothetical protein